MSNHTTIWENARIATMQAGARPYGLIDHGFIVVAGEHIQDIGTAESAALLKTLNAKELIVADA